IFSLHNRLVCFGTTDNVIRLDGKDFLQDVGCTECFDSPNLHFSKTLSTELCLTTQWLLCNERVRSDRTGVHLIVNQVTEFQHICYPNGYRLVKLLTAQSIVQVGSTELR